MIPNSNYAFFYCTFFCTIFSKVGKLFSRNWCVSASLKFYYEKFLINSSISQKNREKKVPQIPQSLKFPLIVKRTYVLYIWEICSFDYWILYFLYKKGNVCKYIYINFIPELRWYLRGIRVPQNPQMALYIKNFNGVHQLHSYQLYYLKPTSNKSYKTKITIRNQYNYL